MQHLEAGHRGLARDDVADRVVAHVPHVDVARRVREHLEYVLLGSAGILTGAIQVLMLPLGLPAFLDSVRIVDELAHGVASKARLGWIQCSRDSS